MAKRKAKTIIERIDNAALSLDTLMVDYEDEIGDEIRDTIHAIFKELIDIGKRLKPLKWWRS